MKTHELTLLHFNDGNKEYIILATQDRIAELMSDMDDDGYVLENRIAFDGPITLPVNVVLSEH